MIVLGLWFLGWRLAATRPEVWGEVGRAGQAKGVLPPVRTAREVPMPQLVCTGAGPLLTGVRRSAAWQAPDGTRFSLN